MPSRLPMHGRNSCRGFLRRWAPALCAGVAIAAITGLIVGPWFSNGYLFATDWPGPRRLDFPSSLSSSALLQASLWALSQAVSAQVGSKHFLVTILDTA